MRVVALPSGQERGRESLVHFLEQCQQQARERAHPQLASISLAVKAMDPLAVWEAIYDPQEYHFFYEKPVDNISISAAGSVLVHTATGSDRFHGLHRWSEEWLEHTLAIGDLEVAFNGPHFLGGFSFEESLPDDYPYAPATAFLPRWQVSRKGDQYGAVANVLIEEQTDIHEVAHRILAAHEKFYSFDYTHGEQANESPVFPEHIRVHDESESRIAYESGVHQALQAIAAGEIQKVVLARTQDISADQPFFPPLILDRLRKRYPTCHVFSLGAPAHIAFLGATPEKLVQLNGGCLYTEAIAGTIPSSESAREDVLLGERLLSSGKDLREHRMVVDMLLERLTGEGLQPEYADTPSLLRLSNVQHLYTPITAPLPDSSILHWVEVLQPTPAVGGVPQEAARRRIEQCEACCRGLYAGSIGWWNSKGEGMFVVGIRSALVEAKSVQLWAGAGIVEGSHPDQEWRETVSKISALQEVFKKPFTSFHWVTDHESSIRNHEYD